MSRDHFQPLSPQMDKAAHASLGTRNMPSLGGARTVYSEFREVNSNEAGARWGHPLGELLKRGFRNTEDSGEQPVLACGPSWLLAFSALGTAAPSFFRHLSSSSSQETAQPHHSSALMGSPHFPRIDSF